MKLEKVVKVASVLGGAVFGAVMASQTQDSIITNEVGQYAFGIGIGTMGGYLLGKLMEWDMKESRNRGYSITRLPKP